MTLEEAYSQCSQLARSHYENFPVGLLVPRHKQKFVHAVYAFARVSDDIADEGYADPRNPEAKPEQAPTPEERTSMMQYYQLQLDHCLQEKKLDPKYQWIFLALRDTIHSCQLPSQLFYDLLSAFQQDILKNRYSTFAEVTDYCRRSANPVGRLVLHLHGIRDENLHILSDHICTALQLANFWQDVSVDLGKDRIYIPKEDFIRFSLTEDSLFKGTVTAEFINCMMFQVERAQDFFTQGKPLIDNLSGKLAWEIRMTWLGGASILEKIRQQNYDTLSSRPKLSKWDMSRLLIKSFLSK